VKLISVDGFEFVIDPKCAMSSGTIKNMLSSPGQFTESLQSEITFRDIKGSVLSIFTPFVGEDSFGCRAVVLERVCQYLHYKGRHTNSVGEIPDFKIEDELGLELLMAADFLDC
ncbi:BTB/POZ protein, partial [Cladochytrium replicatum]